jgi:hypothetical protein
MKKNHLLLLCFLLSHLPAVNAADVPAASASFQCKGNDADFSDQNVAAITNALEEKLNSVFGQNWTNSSVSKKYKKIDQDKMTDIAKISGCAAIVDRSSCSIFFDPEFSNTLGVFMMQSKSAPLRKQFETAIGSLSDNKAKDAAQYCIKSVGKK